MSYGTMFLVSSIFLTFSMKSIPLKSLKFLLHYRKSIFHKNFQVKTKTMANQKLSEPRTTVSFHSCIKIKHQLHKHPVINPSLLANVKRYRYILRNLKSIATKNFYQNLLHGVHYRYENFMAKQSITVYFVSFGSSPNSKLK